MVNTQLQDTAFKLLVDLYEHDMPQSSWDWPADERFARIIGAEEAAELIGEARRSNSNLPAREAAVKYYGIPKKRMAVLRSLVRMGLVTAYWEGLGEGARSEFGVGRVRTYRITDKGNRYVQEKIAK